MRDQSFSAITCANGIQYLQQPEMVAAECRRLLVPGGCLLLAFSTHCFAEKATAGWLTRDMAARAALLQQILQVSNAEVAAAQ